MNLSDSAAIPPEMTPPKSDFSKTVGIVFNLINILLISYLVWKLGVIGLPKYAVMSEYLQIRNSLYLTYTGAFVGIGLFVSARKLSGSTSTGVTVAIPVLIINLILTTFSFALASLITDLLHRG